MEKTTLGKNNLFGYRAYWKKTIILEKQDIDEKQHMWKKIGKNEHTEKKNILRKINSTKIFLLAKNTSSGTKTLGKNNEKTIH